MSFDYARLANVIRGMAQSQPEAICAETAAKFCDAWPLVETLLQAVDSGCGLHDAQNLVALVREALKP